MTYRPVRSWIANRIARHCVLPIMYRRQVLAFENRCQNARRVQLDLLSKIVRFGSDSAFGADFGLKRIRTVANFRHQLPIAGYDHFAPYINRVANGETTAMFPSGESILTFIQTSATTGNPKIFPANKSWFQLYQRGWDVWGVKAFIDHPEMFGLPILQLGSVWKLGETPAGHNIAVSSAMIERYQSPFIKKHYALPPEVPMLKDSEARGYAVARFAAMGPIGLMSTVTPSWFLRVAECIRQFSQELIRDLYQGTIDQKFSIPPDLRRALEWKGRKPLKKRARELEQILTKTGTLLPRDLWTPSLISCWLGGTVGHASKQIPGLFGNVPMRDQGLLTSEGRHTVPMEDGIPQGVLAIDANYYEFIPVDETGSVDPVVLEMHELEVGRNYRLIFSTMGGLYRYDIGDIVQCVGYRGEAPVIEFLQKDGSYCDLEGEKLSAHTVCDAIAHAERVAGMSLACFTLAPMRRAGELPRYALVVEQREAPDVDRALALVRAMDDELRRTVLVYGATRLNRILGSPLLVRIASGEWQRQISREVTSRGASDTQYKHKPLVADLSFLDRLKIVDITDSGTQSSDRRAA
ncbi:MAG: GH3 auxin-responsive promoter family protein [Planctomycetota bacterium]|nr:GH3 auxin-responsive promoter family protein [Planctomycetota bacterium]